MAGPRPASSGGTGSAGASPPSAGRSSIPRAPTLTLALRLKHPPKGASISPVVEVLRGGKVIAKTKPAQFSGGEMARPSLALSKPVAAGHYKLRVRLLEMVADGLAQDSAVVRRSVRARR